MPAGFTIGVKLLRGINAPTNDRPYPVMFKAISSIEGPDGFSLSSENFRIIAAAHGSLCDSRVLFKITQLSIRYPTGERKVIDIDGGVADEDGTCGVPGIAMDPYGRILDGNLCDAEGGSPHRQDTTTTVSSNFYCEPEYQSETTGRWSPEKVLRPVMIKLTAGSEASAVFSKSFEIEHE